MIIISLGSIVTTLVVWLILKSVIGTIAENIGNWVDNQSQKKLDEKIDTPQTTTVKISEEVPRTKESILAEQVRREQIKRKWRESHKI